MPAFFIVKCHWIEVDLKKIIIITFLLFSGIFSVKTFSSDDLHDAIVKLNGENTNINNNNGNLNIINGSLNDETLFVVDFSASMNEKMGYTPKIYLTIDAIEEILEQSGDEMKIGLRIFGDSDVRITDFSPEGLKKIKEQVCTASKLILPIARFNAQNISNGLSYRVPKGVTPIGYSLRQAVQNDFNEGPHLKHIILVTDGEENCGDDPCAYIRHLSETRKDIKVDVIGISLDDNALLQSKCIATYSNGNVYNINSPEDFKIKMKMALDSIHQNEPQKPIPTPPADNLNSSIKYKTYGFQFEY